MEYIEAGPNLKTVRTAKRPDMKQDPVSLKLTKASASIPGNGKPFIIAGPCSAESESQLVQTAKEIRTIPQVGMLRAGVWKPRSRPSSFEGAGVEGLGWLKTAKEVSGLPTAVEVANCSHVQEVMKAGIDAVWIGARSTANPFTVTEIAEALRGAEVTVFVKNPVCPDLGLWIGAFERLNHSNIQSLAAVHRGFATRGGGNFRNQPLWEIPIELKRLVPELPVLCDPSHIAGDRRYVKAVSQQAIDLAMDGLMIESHCSPDIALSDSAQQLTPKELGELLQSLRMPRVSGENGKAIREIDILRHAIDTIDSEILSMIARRNEIAGEIGRYKKSRNMTILQMSRWKELLRERLETADMLGLDVDAIRKIYETIHSQSIAAQSEVMN